MPHIFDRLASLAMAIPNPSTAIFPHGWGDMAIVQTVDGILATGKTADIVWKPKMENRGTRVRRGLFSSPTRGLDDVRVVPIELTEPGAGTDRVTVLMPAWNEEGFDRRRKLAAGLAEGGVASAYFDIPFYGQRRRPGSRGTPIQTVSDFMLMGAGAVEEAHAVLATLAGSFTHLGVGGFSMGGTLAALVSATSPLPLATGLMAASHSPEPVYLRGSLRRAISWKALGGRTEADRISRALGAVSVLAYEPQPHAAHAVLVAARADGYVPPKDAQAVADHWPGSEIRWLRGGHATLWWRHQDDLVEAVGRSFERLRAAPAE